MATRLGCLLILLAATDVAAQRPAVSPEDAAAYRDDAAVLVLRDSVVSDARAPVALPARRVLGLTTALARVRASAHGDCVAGIHAPPLYVLRDVLLTVDTTATWLRALRRGARRTGNARIDRLVAAHGIVVSSFRARPGSRFASVLIRTEEPVNVAALARQFRRAPGVGRTDLNAMGRAGCGGTGISAEGDSDDWTLVYSRHSRTCGGPSTHWTFRVTADRVEYLGER